MTTGELLTVDEDTKRKHDALFDEHKTAWDSLMRRTGTEWKVSISFWTALAAFSGMLLQDAAAINPDIGRLFWPVLAACVLILSAHLIFTLGIMRGNNIDQKKLQYYEKAMRCLSGVEWPSDLQTSIDHAASRKGFLGYWSHYSQLLVTVILTAAPPTIVWWLGSLAVQAADVAAK